MDRTGARGSVLHVYMVMFQEHTFVTIQIVYGNVVDFIVRYLDLSEADKIEQEHRALRLGFHRMSIYKS